MKNLSVNENCFRSSDLPLATTLSLWLPIEEIDRTDPRKVQFIFKKSERLENLIVKYWRGDLKVDPKKYSHALKELKTRIYSESIQTKSRLYEGR